MTTENQFRYALAYAVWRSLLRLHGRRGSELEAYYFGVTRGYNDYDVVAPNYTGSHSKPDKLHSILPTVLKMIGDCEEKVVIDLGCGDGFFTLPFAERGASLVVGADNSRAQIELGNRVSPHPKIWYRVGDVFLQHGGPAHIANAPFVANYARTKAILRHFFALVYKTLHEGGKVAFVFDLPSGKSLQRFGAVKTLQGPRRDETPIEIKLFNGERHLCTLEATYYTPSTIVELLWEVGFKNVTWHQPIVSQEGVEKFGAEFWDEYLKETELGYLTAERI